MFCPFFRGKTMKLSEIIEKVNTLKDNAYDEDTIKGFIEDIDKRIYKEVILTHENSSEIKPYSERYPLQSDDELLADDAYCQLYVFYAISQIDMFNGEYERYANDMISFNSSFSDYKAFYNRNNMPLGIRRLITD